MSRIVLNTGVESHFTPDGTDVQTQVNLNKLNDVTIINVQDCDILVYDLATNQWINTDTIDGGTY
mgnify:CR=1 FL=1